MKNILLIILASISLTLISCNKSEFSKDECEALSMKAYLGFPKASHNLKNYCQKYTLKYTKKVCQKSLEDLIVHGDESRLKGVFGRKIMGCFTKSDKRKWLKK